MTIYHMIHLIHDWQLERLTPFEKKFIKDMKEAVKGVGTNPSNEELKEHCGITIGQINLVKKLGKRFQIQ